MSHRFKNDPKHVKKYGNNMLPWLVLVSLLLVFATAALLLLVKNHVEAAKGSDYLIGANAISGFDCDYSEAQRLYPIGDGILKVSPTRIVYMSVSGKEIYTQDIQMQDPYCIIRGTYALVADQAGFSYICVNSHGLVYSGNVSGQIGFAELSFDGYCALIIEEDNTNGAVCVLDNTGSKLAQWNSVESGYPVSVRFSPKSSVLSIALVDTDGSHMQPNLKQIRIPDLSTGESPYDYAFVSSEASSILPLISYVDEDKLLWSGISMIYALSEGTLTAIPGTFPNINTMVSVNDKIGLFYSEGVGKQVLFACIDSSLNISSPLVLGNRLKAHSAFEKQILIAVDEKLLLVNTESCVIEKELSVDEDIIRMFMTSDDRAVIVTSSGVREIRF